MCYVIVTCRSLLWILVSLVALVLMLSALVSPAWLVGAPRSVEVGNNSVWLTYRPSLGVYTRCKLARGDRFYCSTVTVRGLSTDPSVFPTLWKVTMVSISFGKCLHGLRTTKFRCHKSYLVSTYISVEVFLRLGSLTSLFCFSTFYP